MDLDELDLEVKTLPNVTCRMQGQLDYPYTACVLYKGNKGFVVLEEVLTTGQLDCCSYRETDYEGDTLCMKEFNLKHRKTSTGPNRCYTRP
jgi:hypothetical protein